MLFKNEDVSWINEQIDTLQATIKERCGVEVMLSINGICDAKFLGAETVIDIVCKALHINKIAVFGNDRRLNVLFARYICFAFIRQYVGLQHPAKIAEMFGKDRTTVIHGFQAVENMLNTNNEVFAAMYNKAQQAILNQTKQVRNEIETDA